MIAPIKYISIVCMKNDRDKLLVSLQKCGEIMLCESGDSTRGELSSGHNMRRMEKLLDSLKAYSKKKSLFSQAPEVSLSSVASIDSGELKKAAEMEKMIDEIARLDEENKKDLAARLILMPWEGLKIPLDALGESAYTVTIAGSIPIRLYEKFSEAVKNAGACMDVISRAESDIYAVLSFIKGEDLSAVTSLGFSRSELQGFSGTAAQNISKLSENISNNEERLKNLKETLRKMTEETIAPALLYEQYHAENQRDSAPVGETAETAVITGWVSEDKLNVVKKAISGAVNVYEFEARDPLPEEAPPTVLHNNHFVSQFEGITNMFNAPKYGGIDPNPVMAPWYWLIFGLMMGDAGYGLLMAIILLIGRKVLNAKGSTRKLINVMLYSSVTTMLCGVLFGSYFGETWSPLYFSPLDDPVRMLILTLIIGVAHIFTGLIVKMVANIKAGYFLDAIFDQASWILAVSGLGLLFIEPLKTAGIVLALTGAAIVLCTAGRSKKGLIGKITGGLVGLYGITGYMSDILSYSRILALSLATGVVGMVMNMLAGMIQNSVLGFILSLVIYAAGHIFNLALGLLSAYVHDCRLQYIEFYGKFYEGGGEIFKPFAIRTSYIQIKDDGGNVL